MSTDFHVIEFPLEEGLAPVDFEFLPHGTRTLKIKVTNPDPAKNRKKYVLRSANVPAEFPKTKFFSHEKGSTNFRVSWGGGQEKGACLKGKDVLKVFRPCVTLGDETSYLYLNVTHVSGPINQPATLELGIYPVKNNKDTEPRYKLVVNLVPPRQIASNEVTDPIRMNRLPNLKFSFTGTDVPNYVGRWWSPSTINYTANPPNIPILTMSAKDDRLDIEMAFDGGLETIAHVQDNIASQAVIDESRFFDAELYYFGEHYFVLRLWFSWLVKLPSTVVTDEFPDAERFDFLIDTKKGGVVNAATDSHWREVWVPAARPNGRRHIIANLGWYENKEFLKFFGEKIFGIDADSSVALVEEVIEKAKKWEEAADKSELPRIPHLALEETYLKGERVQHLGVGLEAHVPNFGNAEPFKDIKYVSSDPTEG